jgi:hypothetical protein
VHEYFNSEDKDVQMTPDDYSNYGIRIMSAFNNNITAMVIDANKLSDAPAPVAKAFYYLMETSDREGITLANAGRGIINMVKDPTTWVGLGTLGIGVAGKYAGKRLTKMGVKKLLKGIVLSKPTGASLAVGAEGAIYSAADNYARQTAEVAAEQQEGYNLKELATSGAVGAVVGERLGAGAPNVLEAGRRSIVKLGESAKKRLTEPGETLRSGFDIDPALAKLGDIADIKAPTDKDSGIIAFHGSGSDFNKFSLNKIGTGEGAQAFGYGLYFTDSEDIAKFYKNQIAFQKGLEGASLTYGKEPINLRDMQSLNVGVRKYMGKLGDELPLEYDLVKDPQNLKIKVKSDLIARYEKEISDLRSGEMGDFIGADGLSNNERQALDLERQLNEIKKVDLNQVGTIEPKTYKVALAPKPDELLDYDVSLKNQSEKVRKVLKPYYDKYSVAETADFGTLLASLQRDLPPKLFSEELNKQGIKGIKYKAGQLSGVKDTDATNFVIFDENLINILAKYGIVGPVAVTALKTQSQSDGEKDGNS